jgi:putative membrane protein
MRSTHSYFKDKRLVVTSAMITAVVASMTSFAWATATHDHLHDHDLTGPWWTLWNLRPEVLLALTLLLVAYWRGVSALWYRAGRGRGISHRQSMIFLAGVGALFLALVSPIDKLGQQLGSVHVVQHMLLILVAAPLLVLGSAGQALTWALPLRPRLMLTQFYRGLRRIGMRRYVLWQPFLIWTCFALVIWLLHIPQLYEAALQNRVLHDLQHIAFVVSACLFWRVLLDPISRLRLNPPLSVLYLFATCLQCSAMGVFMAFSPSIWYSAYDATTPQWGVDPLLDQQIAGYTMWLPACFVYALVAAVIFGRWLQEPQVASGLADTARSRRT